jgi:HAD superfamily hydrolase (TIGR01549 family)
MIKGIIIDFDQTIADTSKIEQLRDLRKWDTIKNLYHNIQLIPNAKYFLDYLNERNLTVTIVSNAPRTKYLEGLIRHFNLNVNYIIGYEDTVKHKPNPEPMYKALEMMKLQSTEVLAIGDNINDVISANNAGIKSVFFNDNIIDDLIKIDLQSTDYYKIIEFLNKNNGED